MDRLLPRRRILSCAAWGVGSLLLGGALEAADCEETQDNIEGPFYKAGAPERTALIEPGMPGTRLAVSGRVLNTRCEPVPYAVLDAWHCDAHGVYDNSGYTLRGKIHADKNGRYELRTIVPPAYQVSDKRYRPAHIHLKLSAANVPVFTTQLYFEGDRWNPLDGAYRKSLELRLTDGLNSLKLATFDFHLKTLT